MAAEKYEEDVSGASQDEDVELMDSQVSSVITDFFPGIPWSRIEDKGLGNCTREIINFLKTWITFEDCLMLWLLWESSIKNLVNFWIESQSYTWFSVVARIQSRLSTYFCMALYIPPVVLHSKGYSFRWGPWKNSRMWHIIIQISVQLNQGMNNKFIKF